MEVAETTQKKRILYVITKANWGGAQRYVYDMAVSAKEAGYEVMVACGGEGELTTRLQSAGVTVASIGTMSREVRVKSDIDSFISLIRIVREFKPNIVHTNSSKAGGLAALAARIGGAKRVIFSAHGWAFNENRPVLQKFVIGALHYATVLLSDETICVSNAIRLQAHFMFGVQKRFIVIHHGVDAVSYLDRETARERLAPSSSLPPFWVGTIAELHHVKQLDVLIRAFASISKEHGDAALVIIGEGEERARLEALIAELDLGSRVRLAGHIPEAARYLKALDLFVLPSRSEALAFAILEAGMAHLPVVASRVGGIPEILKGNTNGILVRSGDVPELAQALAMLIERSDRRDEFAGALYERVLTVFSKKNMVSRTLALYKRA